ncbi:condensation domain-containing protein [Streptomyces sp. NPDC051218]|uniref:condensation domain-containing protein n=1 Tax=Streptomyces sp. NPDC051218 TaxID=3365645 RepID=UPI00378BDACB
MNTTNKEKALWLMDELVPDTGINNLGLALHVGGRLRPDVLRAALAIVLGRYETLRTVFHATGAELVKKVVPAAEFAAEIEPLDLTGDTLEKDLTAFVDRPFKLDGRPLVRVGFATGPDGDILCLGVHHLAFDMVSAALFLQAFIPVYDAIAAGGPVPPQATTEVPAFAEPERRPADVTYWRETLRGVTPDGLDLWCCGPRGRQPMMTGENARHTLSPEAQHAVVQLQRAARAPVGAVMLAAYTALLASHGAGPDLVVGSPVDVRGANSSAIGYHVNVVPIRVRVDLADGFRALARQARDAFLGAMAHAGTSVDELAGEIPEIGSTWQSALYRHLFNFLPDATVDELSIDGMTARLLTVENPYSKFDLELVGTSSKAEVLFRYSTETLARADVEAMLRRFEALLIEAAHDPDRPLGETAGWSGPDREAVDRANNTAAPIELPTVQAAFRSWAASTPDAPAVVDGEHTVTYRQVDEDAAAIGALLTGAGVGLGDVVAVAVSQREAAAAALGVWRAGAVCLPLDAGHAPSWLARQLTYSRAKAVLTGAGVRLLADVEPQLPADTEPPRVLPLDTAPAPGTGTPDHTGEPTAPACLFHTCGDDGQPVATVLSHAGLADTVGHFATELAVEPGTGVLTLAAPATFGSYFDLCLALSAGGRVVIAPEEARTGGPALRATADRHDTTVVTLPPGTSGRILEDVADRPHGLTVLVQGEGMSRATARRLLASGCRLHCAYGTLETTGGALSGRADADGTVNQGRPITNTRAFVAAPDGRELPVGLRGELCLAGTGLALTGRDDPAFPIRERYGRHYPTGQLARRRTDGAIEWLGRIDRRIALRDGPVNLGDVETDLLDHPGVTAAAALAVTPTDDEQPTVVAFAETTIETAATPWQVVHMDALPRRPDGRIDRDALAPLAEKALDLRSDDQDPAADDALVGQLVEMWRQLLGREATARTNFFEAGGHSLLAAVLAQNIEELTGTFLELTEVFEHPTPEALAARVRA